MIRQLNILPKQKFIIAFSGGVDSVAVSSFYKNGGKDFNLAYFNHGTEQSVDMEKFCIDFAKKNNIPILIGKISREKNKEESPECFWRNERYSWLKSFNVPIVTCHHLDDVVETWVFSSLHGNPKIINSVNNGVYRPFLLNKKQKFIDWCQSKNLDYFQDQSNFDIKYPRNRIRHILIKECYMINPGLDKVIKKKILSSQ